MNRLTHKEALLLALSGELGDAARRDVMRQVAQDPILNAEYQEAREGMELLATMAIPEPSAEERRRIPATIKKLVHQALQQKEAGPRFSLGRYAAGALAAAVTIAVLAGFWSGERARTARQRGEVAALNASIQKMESLTTPAAVPLALTDAPVPAPSSMPSLANLRERDALNAIIWHSREMNEEPESDPSSPPGSY